jgi:hypothetical protein
MKLRTLGWIGALALLAACNNPVAQDDHARDVAGVEVFDAAQPNTRLAHTVGQGAARRWEGALPPLPVGQTRTLLVRWVDEQGQTLQLGTRYATRVRFAADPADTGATTREDAVVRIVSGDAGVTLTGRSAGQASVVVVLWHGSHDDWASPALPLRVGDP